MYLVFGHLDKVSNKVFDYRKLDLLQGALYLVFEHLDKVSIEVFSCTVHSEGALYLVFEHLDKVSNEVLGYSPLRGRLVPCT